MYTFTHNNETWCIYSKYIESLNLVAQKWNHARRNNKHLKDILFEQIRYPSQRGGKSGAFCFRFDDLLNVEKAIDLIRCDNPNSSLFHSLEFSEALCLSCGKPFQVNVNKQYSTKYCCKKCEFNDRVAFKETSCEICGKLFHLKTSQLMKRKHPSTCSRQCRAILMKTLYRGQNNPNYKARNTDCDGYALCSTHSMSLKDGIIETKLHKAICCEYLGVIKIEGKYFNVHHRDCDRLNNDPNNLAILVGGDHRWLHKQFGNATLFAYTRNMVDKESLVSWSDDPDRANRLLDLCITNQTAEGLGEVIDGILKEKKNDR